MVPSGTSGSELSAKKSNNGKRSANSYHSQRVQSSISNISGVSQKVNPEFVIDHSIKLQNWICTKALTVIQHKSNEEMKQTNKLYNAIVDREATFVQHVDQLITQKEIADLRKKEVQCKRWNRIVYEPIQQHISSTMHGRHPGYFSKRKRQLHNEYIELLNKRKYAALDTYSPGDYYPFALHPSRPYHSSDICPRMRESYAPEIQKSMTDDPITINEKLRNSEERIILQCQTGADFSDKDLAAIRLPPLPLVPQGRHGTTCNTWMYMPFTDIDSKPRVASRRRMRPTTNSSQFSIGRSDPDELPAEQGLELEPFSVHATT